MTARGVYLGDGDRALFGMLHTPAGDTARATAIVIVPPLGYEALCSARALGDLASRLAARGFWVLRYDHLGTGDSAGQLDDPDRIAAWVDGSRRVCAALMAATDATGVSLVGLRGGALFALAAARGNSDAKSLVLWALPPNGRGLVREIRALSQFGQRRAEQTLVESAGFGFRSETLAELTLLDARELAPSPATRALLIPRDDVPPPPPSAFGEWIERAELVALPGYAAMMRDPHESIVPEPTFEAIASWLDLAHPERGARREVLPTTEVRLSPSQSATFTTTERAIRFGPGDRLFGIVTEPLPGPRGPCVLWINPGAISRVGMNRNYVGFARELAQNGVRSFRFDLSGLGDSGRDIGAPSSVLYSKHAVPDVRAAMDLLERDHGEKRFVLAGLCAGAYAAFHTALDDERVSGVMLLNPQTFDYKPGDSLAIARRETAKAARWYRRSALDPQSWKKAWRGEVDFTRIARLLGQRALSVTRDRVHELAAPSPSEPSALAASFQRLLARDLRILLVFSDTDPGLDHLRHTLGRELELLTSDPRFELEIVRGPDHTFTPIWSQKLLGRILRRHLVDAHAARHMIEPADAVEPSRPLVSVARKSAKHAAGAVLPRSWLIVRGPRRRRRIALTFDDGPTQLTHAYLDVLAQHGVRATFFLVGRACSLFPEQAASIAEHGHEIGGHGFSHRTFPELAGRRLMDELEQTQALLPGKPNGQRLVRPPHGSISPRSLLQCARAGFTTVLWSYDSGDSRARTAGEILDGFERSPPESGDIVLLHEDHERTLEALPLLLHGLEDAGYELCTVGELFRPGPEP